MAAQLAVENASQLQWHKISQILLDAGAEYDIRSAIHLGDTERVRTLLKMDPTFAKQKDLMRYTAQDGRDAIVKLLLENKADLNDADYGSVSILYFAVEHPKVVKILLDAGANLKGRLHFNDSGPFPRTTVLQRAVDMGQVESARLLIAHGAEIDARSLQSAVQGGRLEMMNFLIDQKDGAALFAQEGPI